MSTKRVPSIKEQLAAEGLTLGDLRYVGQVPVSRKKWGNVPVDDQEDGHFDSSLEYSTWVDLKRRQQLGEIDGLQRQVSYGLIVAGVVVSVYRADFVFYEGDKIVVADAKGKATPEYIMKYWLMLALYGVRIREYTEEGIAPERKFRTVPKTGG